jgi:hypothetical protein
LFERQVSARILCALQFSWQASMAFITSYNLLSYILNTSIVYLLLKKQWSVFGLNNVQPVGGIFP